MVNNLLKPLDPRIITRYEVTDKVKQNGVDYLARSNQ